MKNLLAMVVASFGCLALHSHAAVSPAIMVRGSGSMRLWQTAFSPDEPLRWLWRESDEATVVVSNVLSGVSSEYVVSRSGVEPCGGISLPLPEDVAVECLFDVNVTLFSEDKIVESKVARVAVLPSCREGGSCRLPDANSKSWYRLDDIRLGGFDAAWFGAMSSTATLETTPVSGKQGSVYEFPSDSGYFPVNVRKLFGSPTGGTLELSFQGMPSAAEVLLMGTRLGFAIFVR